MLILSRTLWRLFAYMIVIFLCPLVGVRVSQKPVGPYLEFPPIPEKIQSLPFSWGVFCLIAAFAIIALKPFLSRIDVSNIPPSTQKPTKYRFPVWGWLGAVLMIMAWVVAWNRFSWFQAWQEFTFTPLWLSYILIINAMTFRRIGRCLLINQHCYYGLLFLVSACFWWSFEYLNRFVQNWYYVGITGFGSVRYFIYATLPFSTVLPAVLGTAEWLDTFPRLSAGLERFERFRPFGTKAIAVPCLVAAAAGLVALGVWPKTLYSLVWLLPILLVIGLQSFAQKPNLVLEIEAGDWRRVWILALSGLICGFFWEMWNINSLAHWQYSIPYVQRFEIFEMPLLGYLGYLPFGVLCGLFAEFTLPLSVKSGWTDHRREPKNSHRACGAVDFSDR